MWHASRRLRSALPPSCVRTTTFGELASLTSRHGTTTPLYSEVMDSAGAARDALGRITTRVETTASGTAAWQYVYDLRGRLEEVFKNGTSVERFVYDPNGNRTSRITPTETSTGVYDDQDRLLSYGAEYLHVHGQRRASDEDDRRADDDVHVRCARQSGARRSAGRDGHRVLDRRAGPEGREEAQRAAREAVAVQGPAAHCGGT